MSDLDPKGRSMFRESALTKRRADHRYRDRAPARPE
jgi:hypothetical protein